MRLRRDDDDDDDDIVVKANNNKLYDEMHQSNWDQSVVSYLKRITK